MSVVIRENNFKVQNFCFIKRDHLNHLVKLQENSLCQIKQTFRENSALAFNIVLVTNSIFYAIPFNCHLQASVSI